MWATFYCSLIGSIRSSGCLSYFQYDVPRFHSWMLGEHWNWNVHGFQIPCWLRWISTSDHRRGHDSRFDNTISARSCYGHLFSRPRTRTMPRPSCGRIYFCSYRMAVDISRSRSVCECCSQALCLELSLTANRGIAYGYSMAHLR